MTAPTFTETAITSATGFARRGRWVPWALFGFELIGTAIIIGVLSIVFVVQLTVNPLEILLLSNLFFGLFVAAHGALSLLLAVFVFLLTGFVVGVLGLPVRFVGPLRRFWLGNGELTVFGVLAAVILIAVAYYPLGEWTSKTTYLPSPWPFLAGWLLLAFSLSMFVWPARWLPARARTWWTETQLTPPTR